LGYSRTGFILQPLSREDFPPRSREDVAARLGKQQSFVAKCESGERRVDIVELAAFAKLYGKTVEFFVPPNGERGAL
jgi:hypothetical protein